MKGIFIGSVAFGFRLDCVVADEMVEETISSLTGKGLVDTLDIRKPSSLDKRLVDSETGHCYIVFYNGFSGGASLFGPFQDEDIAEEFGEEHRPLEEEWCLFVLDPKE